MAWFNDYDRMYNPGYDRMYSGSWYNREAAPGARPGGWGDRFQGRNWSGARGSQFGRAGYGYEYEYRTPPDQSPTYGRQGDQEVQRWAQRHGYDAGMQISPGQGGRGGRYGGEQGWMGGGGGRPREWGRGEGGRGASRGDRDRWGGWNYRW